MSFSQRILRIYDPFKTPALMIVGLLVLIETLGLVAPYLFGEIINKISANAELWSILKLAFIAYGIQAVRMGSRFLKDRVELFQIDFAVDNYAENLTKEKLLQLSVGQHRSQNSGKVYEVVVKGMHSLKAYAKTMLYDVFPHVFQVVITIVALLWMNVILGSIVFLAALIFTLISVYLNSKMRGTLDELEEERDENRKFQHDVLKNLELIQTNSQEKRIREEYMSRLYAYTDNSQKHWYWYIKLAYGRIGVLEVAEFCVLVLGIIFVSQGSYGPGALVIFIMWTHSALAGIKPIGHIHRRLLELSATIRKFFKVLDVPPNVTSPQNPVQLVHVRGDIEFRNVTFTYPELAYLDDYVNKPGREPSPAIRNLSVHIRAGERVAFIGRSGAGKSTIISLLLRFYDPEEGQVFIDGHDLSNLDLKEYREAIGYVEQSVSLFDETLRYNLLFGLNGRAKLVDDEEMNNIAEVTCIDRFYDRLTDGFDTVIGENGIQLSGGERQRVGIARALLKDPRILILDEATSNLDAENEALIKESIDSASEGRTTIIIAHRLSTIIDCDRIFVMNKGELVATGYHAELLETCDIYRGLIEKQMYGVIQ